MKIYITGSSGSGKTTYANKVAKELKIPVYRTDDFYNETEKRMFTAEEIKKVVKIDSDWIIEGAYYIPEYVKAADKVIYMKIGLLKAIYRIFKRWFTDVQTRKRFDFWSTIRLCFITVGRSLTSDGVDIDTDIPSHYKEKDRYNLCKANAKKLEVIKG